MMKKIYALLVAVSSILVGNGQCSTQTLQAQTCVCKDGSSDCALLPDLSLSWFALDTYMNGPSEYSQIGNGENNGRLRITGSTPNTGHGSFTVLGSNNFVCGTDTLTGDPGTCPDGNPPRQLIVQRVYYKNSDGTMTYEDRWAGAMTYHPTHGHNHVDDWVVFTLRMEDPNDPNPLNWPIIGNGAKIGFCLMDYGTCSYYNGHCRDDNTLFGGGNALLNGDFPNYGLGGGNYGCSPTIQGISSGYTDIYSENLDGMWIDIPPGTCNGDYWIVGLVDPNNNFLEENENDNWTAIPFTLTQQTDEDFQAGIMHNNKLTICEGDSVLLTATPGMSYEWNNGITHQTIYAKDAGEYHVTVTSMCGTDTSDPITIQVVARPENPSAEDKEICAGETLTLTATGTEVHWFDENMAEVGVGNSIDVEGVLSSTVFYAQDHFNSGATIEHVGKEENGNGFYSNATASLVFHVYQQAVLKSVKIYAQQGGNVTVKLKNNLGQLIQQKVITVAEGEHRAYLNFDLPVGNGFYLEASGNNMPFMFRSNEDLAYPYAIPNVISIIAPTTAYNYFFDWEVITSGAFCPSELTSVQVTVNCSLGIDEMDLDEYINVYPNPASTSFHLDFQLPEPANTHLEIRNAIGAIIFSKQTGYTQSIHEKVSTESLSKGVYFIAIQVEGKSYTRKLIIH
jgi:hypothetical protein